MSEMIRQAVIGQVKTMSAKEKLRQNVMVIIVFSRRVNIS